MNEMERDEFMRDAFETVSRAYDMLATSAPARDSYQRAQQLVTLTLYVEEELAERFPAYRASAKAEQSGLAGLVAVGMLCDAPDLLQLALERATNELDRNVFGQDDIHV